MNPKDIEHKLRRLAEMTTALLNGAEKHFEATRLTSLKSLCQERDIAMRLGLYLAEHAREQMQDKSLLSSLDDAEWERYKQRGSQAIAAMRAYLQSPTDARRMALHKHLSQVHAAQDETARRYAERFDSRYGSGLNPESAPFLQDIVRFWMPDYA